jgi:hypothetical protein
MQHQLSTSKPSRFLPTTFQRSEFPSFASTVSERDRGHEAHVQGNRALWLSLASMFGANVDISGLEAAEVRH